MLMHIHKKFDIHDTSLFLTFFSSKFETNLSIPHTKPLYWNIIISHASEFNFLSETENLKWKSLLTMILLNCAINMLSFGVAK